MALATTQSDGAGGDGNVSDFDMEDPDGGNRRGTKIPGKYGRLKELNSALKWSRGRLQKFREDRLKLVKQYVGFYYGEEHSQDRVPVNYILEMATIYIQRLAASEPRVLITTKYPQLKSFAETFSLALNHLVGKRLGFRATLQRAVLDAMFTRGTIKVGLNYTPGNMAGEHQNPAEPFADCVSLDEWVHDCQAKSWEQCAFMGDRYDIDYEFFKESGLFQNTDALKPVQKDSNEDRASQLTEGYTFYGHNSLYDAVQVWDIFLPKEKLILTIPAGKNAEDVVLRTVEWEGPEHGPYHFLGFNPVPDNILGVSPLFSIYDMHDAGNRLYNKLIRQGERQKNIGVVLDGDDTGAERIQRAKDGEIYRITGRGIEERNFGGINQQNLAFFMQMGNLLDQMGGNLKTLGGLGASADTLGQDQMITASASTRVANMTDEVYAFVQPIVRDLAWWLFYDPMVDLLLQRQIPGTDIQVPVQFNQEEREGDFLDYNFEIEPYSLQRESPQTRLAAVQNVINVLTPLAPLMQQQGIQINVEGYLRTIARYTNMTELQDFISFGNVSQQPENPIGQPPPDSKLSPSSTNRTYTRVSTSKPSSQGKMDAMMSTMLGAGIQDKEKNGMMTGG